MSEMDESTTVVIVGAGVAGLALGTFLLRAGIDCVILEKRSRDYVERRQRAGVIDSRAARMFRERGLEERVLGGAQQQPTDPVLNFRVDGVTRPLALAAEHHDGGRFIPQRVLVHNLMTVFLADGGDLRFESDAEVLEDGVRYTDPTGATRVVHAEIVAGCDGDRGVSRASIPAGVLTRHEHDYGYAWLTVLAEVPANHQSMMAIHERGFAGQFARGPRASRFYLQVPLGTRIEEWPGDRIWDEIETRFGEPVAERGTIGGTRVVPLRAVVHGPMRHDRLFLLGDAAHIIPPMSAKGMNLALHDAEVLADAVVRWKADGDASLLDAYSATCLDHIWNYQAYAMWFTDLMHDAGDPSYRGEFRRRVARADLDRLFVSPSANRLFSEFMAGLA